MSATLAHRGPDDTGCWSNAAGTVAFGFRRLAIIDLSPHGHQPMRSASGRFMVVFNGEIYNYLEVRETLEGEGVGFHGHSDTEVICAGFERWGIEAAVRRFVGMFAIAVWDAQERQLSLVRDRLGIKPLFYSSLPGVLTFGSELKALAAHPAFDRTIDTDALAAYFRYLYVPAPMTIYRHARKLLPGHILQLGDAAGVHPDPRPYWSLDDAYKAGARNPFDGSDAEAIQELTRLLGDAVRLRMRSDVPLGALLSGGIDSSVVVGLMQANAARPTRTFSIAFPGTEHDEAIHAAQVAKRLGTDHTEMAVTGADALAVVPQLSDLYDEPLADPSQIPTHLVCKLARRDVTVALSGDGGDEVFGGYERYIQGERLISRVSRMPAVVKGAAAAAIGAASSGGWDTAYRFASKVVPAVRGQRLVGTRVRKVGDLLRQESEGDMYRSLLSAWQNPEALLVSRPSRLSRVEECLAAAHGIPLRDRMMLLDQQTYLADDLLAKLDRASMAVGLEARVPLLDHRVVEFSWRLKPSHKIRDGRGKWLLREVLHAFVEPDLVDRAKVGFSVPIGAWLRGPLRAWGAETLFADADAAGEFLRVKETRSAWDQVQKGDDRLALGLWSVLIFQSWRRRWLS